MRSVTLDAFPDAVLLADDQRQYVGANAAACKLLRRTHDEILAMKIEDLVSMAPDIVEGMWGEMIAKGSLQGEVELTIAGEPINVDFRASANIVPGVHLSVLRRAGEPVGIPLDVLIELIGMQRRAFKTDARLDDVLHDICERATRLTGAAGATIELEDGEFLRYHVATGTMAAFRDFRVRRDGSLSGLSLTKHEVMMSLDTETDARVDRDACRKVRARSMLIVPLVEADITGVLKVISDRPAAFSIAHQELLRLIAGFLAATMAAAKVNELRVALAERERVRVAELERLREEMTHLLIHDLRSPLTVIMANLDYLRDELPPGNQEAIDAAIDAVRATQRLDMLIKMLLETARLEQGRFGLTTTRIDLEELMTRILSARTAPARTKGVGLSAAVGPGLAVQADVELVSRVIDNILDNAFRYTPKGGRIAVSAEPRERSIVLRLANTGTALPADQRERIFQKFEQVEPRTRRHFGLGLYFCRLAIEAHGGRIWADSTADYGAVFAIELPVATA
ncbi:MAG: GAF domain-containing protein [Deltaproteobacteria bacterium]|nr:GAF domain-containing protein [Deltaproteobacteria bacterium]